MDERQATIFVRYKSITTHYLKKIKTFNAERFFKSTFCYIRRLSAVYKNTIWYNFKTFLKLYNDYLLVN